MPAVHADQVKTPLSLNGVMNLLKGGLPDAQISRTIDDQGISFQLTKEIEQEVRRAGGTERLIAALQRASQRRAEGQSSGTGALIVKTTPAQANVYLNGEFKGKSSEQGELRLQNLQPGTYSLRVALAGFSDYDAVRPIAAGEEQIVCATLLQKSAPGRPLASPPRDPVARAQSVIPVPGVKVEAVQFYEGPPDQDMEKEQRQYQSSFDRFTTRAIFWELDLSYPPPGRRIEFQVEIVWYKPDGSQMVRQALPTFVLEDWGTSWETLGYGYAEPGHWLPGTYRVEMFVKNARIAGGSFRID